MRKISAILCILLVLLYTSNAHAQNTAYSPEHLFSVPELQQDFLLLRNNLEHTHPNLYMYVTKKQLNIVFDSLYSAINTPMTDLQFYVLITPLCSIIANGHSYMLPSEESRNWFNKYSKFFPLHITNINGKIYADMNCSADTAINDGAEILNINGVPAAGIFNELLIRQVRDGNNLTYPTWILNNWFREYYSYMFGHATDFKITYKNCNAETRDITISALTKDSINFYMQYKYARRLASKENKGITLTFDSSLKTAMLKIKTFEDDDLKEQYKQDFKSTIRQYFIQIRRHKVENLILDLRDNQGGDPENGVFLLSYLVDHPFEMIHKGPVSAGIFKPAKYPYKHKLYVLINGGSFSNTGMVSGCLEFYKRGIFIGEEAGGNKYILSGDPKSLILPHTKIDYELCTTTYILRKQNNNTGHGVMPEYVITQPIEDIINGRDEVKEFALGLITQTLK